MKLAALTALALCVSAAALAADTDPPLPPDAALPGYWDTTDTVVEPIPITKHEMRCVQAKDVARMMRGFSNSIYHCTYPVQTVGDGKLRFEGSCVSNGGRHADVKGSGTYTPTTLHVEGEVHAQWAGLPIVFAASTDAHRVADACPAGSIGSN